ncbi:hypothetical protein BKL68_14195 [Staphylococcus aureus]|nr:hypothetical protein BKL68_14195 [Staphylococcus aureus]
MLHIAHDAALFQLTFVLRQTAGGEILNAIFQQVDQPNFLRVSHDHFAYRLVWFAVNGEHLVHDVGDHS